MAAPHGPENCIQGQITQQIPSQFCITIILVLNLVLFVHDAAPGASGVSQVQAIIASIGVNQVC